MAYLPSSSKAAGSAMLDITWDVPPDTRLNPMRSLSGGRTHEVLLLHGESVCVLKINRVDPFAIALRKRDRQVAALLLLGGRCAPRVIAWGTTADGRPCHVEDFCRGTVASLPEAVRSLVAVHATAVQETSPTKVHEALVWEWNQEDLVLYLREASTKPVWAGAAASILAKALSQVVAGMWECPRGATLVHGDAERRHFRSDGQAARMIDWECATIGHPALDVVAMMCEAADNHDDALAVLTQYNDVTSCALTDHDLTRYSFWWLLYALAWSHGVLVRGPQAKRAVAERQRGRHVRMLDQLVRGIHFSKAISDV